MRRRALLPPSAVFQGPPVRLSQTLCYRSENAKEVGVPIGADRDPGLQAFSHSISIYYAANERGPTSTLKHISPRSVTAVSVQKDCLLEIAIAGGYLGACKFAEICLSYAN